MTVEEQLKKIPHQPGVYRYYDNDGNVLYIGKAKNLKKRVSSYFNPSKNTSARLRLLVRKIDQIEYTIVPSEKDAFLLENSLIKEFQPKYNIQLKDDKSFPYIVIVNEDFPRIFLTRQKRNDGSQYFGPYTSVKYVRGTLEMIKSLYPIRSCALNLSEKQIRKNKYKVCLEYHLKNCLGPCEAKQSEEAYMENIKQIKNILKGKTGLVKSMLKEEMKLLAEKMDFETANEVKKKIKTLEQYVQRSSIVHPRLGNLHVLGFTQKKDKTFLHYFQVENGTIITSRNLVLKRFLDEPSEDILAFALSEIIPVSNEAIDIITPTFPSEQKEWWNIIVPQRGERKVLLDLATKNALLLKHNQQTAKPFKQNETLLTKIQEDLHLKDIPFHIECFDNSNLQGSHPVASMVVFKNAKPSKKEYRHYHIKTVEGPNDFASMEEVVYRRYKRLLEEDAPLPQLVIVDGGKGQLSSAYKSLERLGLIDKLQLVGIAKRLEEIYYPHDELPYNLDKRSPTLKVMQHLRNEAHRFAITFHRNLRSKNAFVSELIQIKGIGQQTEKELIKAFKSVKRVKEASTEDLEAIVGHHKADIIQRYFKSITSEENAKK